jgi:GH18 family chitinase
MSSLCAFYKKSRRGMFLFLAGLALGNLLWIATVARAQTLNHATGEIGTWGSLNSGDYNATSAEDGSYEKIAEVKDVAGNYRIDWLWQFEVAAGPSFELNLRAQATNTKQGMDHYDFLYKKPGDADWAPLGTVTQTTMTSYRWFFPEDVSGGLQVRAVDTNPSDDQRRANQLWIDRLTVETQGVPSEPLGPPTGLSAIAASETSIDLAWTDNALAEDGFQIDRRTGEEDFAPIAEAGPDAEAYSDTGLTPFTTYDYRVRAFDASGPSAYSNEASATTRNSAGGATGPVTDKIIAGYFPSWGIYNARKYWVRHIPFDRITHVNYAFANVDPDTLQVVIGDSFAELTNRKDPETDNGLPAGNLRQLTHYRDVGHNGPAYNHLKVIISVGGWSWSENFSSAALTPESRWIFAESLKNFVAGYNLDGADLDWEYPTGDPGNCGEAGNVCRAEDPVHHALLIMACRAKLDELGPGKELSIAVPAGFNTIAGIMPPLLDNSRLTAADGTPLVIMRNPEDASDSRSVDLGGARVVDMLNWVHIMNYDMVSAVLEDTTRHHAPLYGYEGGDPAAADPAKEDLTKFNSHFAIQAYRFVHDDYSEFDPDNPGAINPSLTGEIPASKLTFGVPMYGRGFKSVDGGDWQGYPGLFQFTDSSTRRRVPKGTWDGGKWGNTGVFTYWDILLNHGGDSDEPGHSLWRVPTPMSLRPYGPYILKGDLFIGFDDRASIAEKMEYVVEEEMGGVMFWDFPGDVSLSLVEQGTAGAYAAYPEKSLIHQIADTLESLFGAP